MRYAMLSGIDITVLPGVYPPSDDTFLLIDALRPYSGGRALEVCSGTGAVGLSLASRVDSIVAVDINPCASRNTLLNFSGNNLIRKVDVLTGDLFSPLGETDFDIILMNPPYLLDGGGAPYDLSWSGGSDGRTVIDRFIRGVGGFLIKGGRAILLQSSLNGIEKSLDIMRRNGLEGKVIREACFQFERLVVIEARKP